MLKWLKRSFWVPYEDTTVYPAVQKAHQAIAEYCRSRGFSCTFPNEDTVVIDGTEHEIHRGYNLGCRGYSIKCREK